MPMVNERERTVVKTYVPAEQKEEWTEHADRLEMSQSEFVRTMVQAGRRGFGAGDTIVESTPSEGTPEQPGSSDATPRGDALEDRVLDVLRDGTHSWDELVEAVVGELEADLDETLQRLQSEGRIRYSGRTGGYELVES